MQLTAEALLLVEHAEAVLERLERAEADLAAARGAATGTDLTQPGPPPEQVLEWSVDERG